MPSAEKPLVNDKYLLEKFHGKGGWTYARIPEIPQDKHAPFGWRKVKGTVDGYSIKRYHLMPMGQGMLFLPVKAEIRKKIGKREGDYVHVILYPDHSRVEVPDEFLLCLKDEPAAWSFFKSLSDGEKNYYVQWIYSAKKEETKVTRIAKSIAKLSRGMKFYVQED